MKSTSRAESSCNYEHNAKRMGKEQKDRGGVNSILVYSTGATVDGVERTARTNTYCLLEPKKYLFASVDGQ